MAARIKKLSFMSLIISFLFTTTTLRAQDRDAVVLFIRQFSGNTTVAWPFDARLLQAQTSTEPAMNHVTPGAPAQGLEVNPSQREMGRKPRLAESEWDLQALRSLSSRSVSKESADVSNAKKIALRCAQETEKSSGYISELAIRDRTRKELSSTDYVSLMWRIDFIKPDQYHVTQKAWSGRPDYVYDEWVTLGAEHHDNVGLWVKSPQGSSRTELNPSFRADKYLSILRTEEPKSAGIYDHAGRRYYLLEYESSNLGDFTRFSRSLKGPAHIHIWIDLDTGLLAKGELAGWNTEPAGKQTPFELDQAFAGYGLDIQIKVPQVQATRIQNIAPDEMWKRVTQCVLPTYPSAAYLTHITGIVDLGLGVSPSGDVSNVRVLRTDQPFLAQSALDAIRQWKFHPNVVQGEVTWSRIRALARFNADGSTAIDLAQAILPDNFGDPGIPARTGTRSAFLAEVAVPRPESARACNSTEHKSGAPANVQLGRLARQAYDISDDQASRLEENLNHDPNDLAARALLLEYYFAASRRLSPEVLHEARLRHIAWLVQNHPESELAGMSEATIDPAGGPLADYAGYEKVKALWLEQVKAHDDTVMVLANAAWFFKLPDKPTAARLLMRLHTIDPGNQNWSSGLGMVYAGAIVGLTGMNQNRFPTAADPEEARGASAQQAREELSRSEDAQLVGTAGHYLSFWGGILNSVGKAPSDYADLAEKCFARAEALDPGNLEWPRELADVYELRAMKAKSPEERTSMLEKRLGNLEKALSRVSNRGALADFSDLANAAYEAGEFGKAENYARKALELASQNRSDSYYGPALNRCNSVLGRVALHAGEVEKAKSFLLAAEQIPREAKFNYFPDMHLAKELLEHGERQTVLDYLELCKRFWSSSGNPLDGWIQTIKSGGTPDWR